MGPWARGYPGQRGGRSAGQRRCLAPLDPALQPTLAGAWGLARKKTAEQYREWWNQTAVARRYSDVNITSTPLHCPPELHLPRPTLHNLLSMRTGHGDFDWYHREFKTGATSRCSCGRVKSPTHIVYCRKTNQLRNKWPKLKPEPKTRKEYWAQLISSPEAFASFTKTTGYYDEICPPSLRIRPAK